MAALKPQDEEVPEPGSGASPTEQKARPARVGRITSRGKEYTTVWLPREIGERMEKGARYTPELGEDGVLVLRPAAVREAEPR